MLKVPLLKLFKQWHHIQGPFTTSSQFETVQMMTSYSWSIYGKAPFHVNCFGNSSIFIVLQTTCSPGVHRKSLSEYTCSRWRISSYQHWSKEQGGNWFQIRSQMTGSDNVSGQDDFSKRAPMLVAVGNRVKERIMVRCVEFIEPFNVGMILLSPSLRSTLELLELYVIDPRGTKCSLVNSPTCSEFLDSEWTNILAGRTINLDAVLSDYYLTSNNN